MKFFFPGPPFIWLSSEKVSLTFRVGFPTSNNLIRLIPHRCAQQLISQVSANPVKLLAKTNPNNLHLSRFLSGQTLSQPTGVHTLLDTLYREGTLSIPLHTGHSFYLQKRKCNQIPNILKCAVIASRWQSPAIQPLAWIRSTNPQIPLIQPPLMHTGSVIEHKGFFSFPTNFSSVVFQVSVQMLWCQKREHLNWTL